MEDLSKMTDEQKRAWALDKALYSSSVGAPTESVLRKAEEFRRFVERGFDEEPNPTAVAEPDVPQLREAS